MKENEVDEKIKKVCFWVFGFFFWFLVVGFFLKSNYPIYKYVFNTQDAYDVITDGLMLSAYFLAPAIAYVLFTDWRIQYRAIKEDGFYDEVELSLNKLKDQCTDIFWDIAARSIDPKNIQEKISQKFQAFSVDFNELKIKFEKNKPDRNKTNEIFLRSSKDVIELLDKAYIQLIFVQADFFSLQNGQIEDQKMIDGKKITFTQNKEGLEKCLDNIKNKLNDLGKNKPPL